MNPSFRTVFLVLVLVGTAVTAGAAELTATVATITGKVQVQKGTDWVALKVGQTVPLGATVSTGFRSELQLKIGPSTITVKALSRLTVQSLVQNGTTASTDLYLKVGKVSAEVNKSDTVQTQKFTVKSPVATASVRGTEFNFDGVNLQVTRGIVDFIDSKGIVLSVPVGEAARAGAPGTNQGTLGNADLVAQDSTTRANASSDYGTENWSDDDWMSFLSSLSEQDLKDLLDAIQFPNTYVFVMGISE